MGRRLTTALLRFLFRDRDRWVMPHVVVKETSKLAALYVPPGTRGLRPRLPFIEDPSQLRTMTWDHVEHVWARSHCLRLLFPGAAHCLYLFWGERDWAFEGWYVNLQEPFRRTPIAFETRDHALDIVVRPDGSWRWKDEDDLELATGLGVFTPDEAIAIRAEGERVIAAWPFPTGWEAWRPDPTWPLPELPESWADAPS